MELLDIMKQRHSVRSYVSKPMSDDIIEQLNNEIEKCNQQGQLHIQMFHNEKGAFEGLMAHYGKFKGVENYIALVGPKSKDLDEKIGYYGEHIVLKAQELGLNTCWVALTFNKRKTLCQINSGEKLVCILALGYGETQGITHKSKKMDDVCQVTDQIPKWFQQGVEAALLAPTAMNQQKFKFTLNNQQVYLKSTGGFYSHVDLGIVKYHFEKITQHQVITQ